MSNQFATNFPDFSPSKRQNFSRRPWVLRLDIAVAQIEFMGEIVGSTVIFGPDDAEPILGVTALESVGIEVDPRSQRLKRLPAVRLK